MALTFDGMTARGNTQHPFRHPALPNLSNQLALGY
jgi:hypothetical protein